MVMGYFFQGTLTTISRYCQTPGKLHYVSWQSEESIYNMPMCGDYNCRCKKLLSSISM